MLSPASPITCCEGDRSRSVLTEDAATTSCCMEASTSGTCAMGCCTEEQATFKDAHASIAIVLIINPNILVICAK